MKVYIFTVFMKDVLILSLGHISNTTKPIVSMASSNAVIVKIVFIQNIWKIITMIHAPCSLSHALSPDVVSWCLEGR
jgi:hypothetical protein